MADGKHSAESSSDDDVSSLDSENNELKEPEAPDDTGNNPNISTTKVHSKKKIRCSTRS